MAGFQTVAELAERMASTGSRLTKRAEIAAAILAVHAEVDPTSIESPIEMGHPGIGGSDVGRFCLYLAGLPFAEADPRKLNAGGALLTKAVLAVSGATDAELTAAYRRHGDLGAAAYDLWVAHSTSQNRDVGHPILLRDVQEAFAAMAGARNTAVRAALVDGLLRRAIPLEAKYLLKLMLGDMRIGVKQSLVEEAIAVAASNPICAESAGMGHTVSVSEVRHAVMLEADLGGAAHRAFAGTLLEAKMRLFHPLGFMLASPVETPEEAIARFTAKPEKKDKPGKREKGKGKRRRGEPEMVVSVDAAEEGFAEDVEMAAVFGEGEPRGEDGESSHDHRDDAAVSMGHPAAGGVQAFLEDKFDGMRAQVHFGDFAQAGRVAIYSRNREDITESFPELVEAFAQAPPEHAGVILDGEILGWDHTEGKALPFAVLGQRIGRKRVTNEIRQSIPVVFMAFDLMFEGGELLLPLPLYERRRRLEAFAERVSQYTHSPLMLTEASARKHEPQTALFGHDEEAAAGVSRLMISQAKLVRSAEEIDRAYADARARANEGVMLKAAGSAYLPGRRGLAWVKLKRELGTLDVVITGAEYGSGRKAPFLSDYTFAVRNALGELENVGKAYSGVTDAEIAELTEFLKAHTIEDRGHFRTVEPLVILEVAFNNIMRSERHASGFALRFPRIVRIRTDKPLTEIDTVERVEEIYQSQVDKPVEMMEDALHCSGAAM